MERKSPSIKCHGPDYPVTCDDISIMVWNATWLVTMFWKILACCDYSSFIKAPSHVCYTLCLPDPHYCLTSPYSHIREGCKRERDLQSWEGTSQSSNSKPWSCGALSTCRIGTQSRGELNWVCSKLLPAFTCPAANKSVKGLKVSDLVQLLSFPGKEIGAWRADFLDTKRLSMVVTQLF